MKVLGLKRTINVRGVTICVRVCVRVHVLFGTELEITLSVYKYRGGSRPSGNCDTTQ